MTEMTPMEAMKWRTDGVKVVRATTLNAAMSGNPRATVFDFAGTDGKEIWIGTVSLGANAKTGFHHHGRTEAAIYVVRGRGQIRWGERLEFAAEVGAGDFVYFAPHVPHQELNLDADAPLDLISVRSNRDGILVNVDRVPAEVPETIF
jgi:uncharacterized RmlC-like cupin family protein